MLVKRYTADELHGDMYYTLPDDAEFVSASDYEALLARDNIKTFAAQEVRIAELEAALLGYQETKWMLAGRDKELADTTAELARVKAESLRVVPVEPAESSIAYDWYMTRDGELGWHGADKDSHECVETPEGYHFLGDCKPVRLERWEDEG